METSTSLLERLQHNSKDDSWQQFFNVYSPLIQHWLRRHCVADQDCNDLVQEVLIVVTRRLPDFQHNERQGAFRNWLRVITVNCLRDFWRKQRIVPKPGGGSDFQSLLSELEDPGSGMSRLWNMEHDQYVTRSLLEQIKPMFEGKTWQAFQRVVLEGANADEVAKELDTTANAVFIAKSRVLTRLRQEAKGFINEFGFTFSK